MVVKQRMTTIEGKAVPYELRRRKGHRHLTLSVRDTGIILTAPYYVSVGAVERYIAEKEQWLHEALSSIVLTSSRSKKNGKVDYERHKKQAHALITQRLEALNQYYGFSYKRVHIRNTRTRWGSCSSSGTLSFSYKVLFLPPHLQDYVLVHELCHLKEMNHSMRFWALVAECVPDYKEMRRELRHSSAHREVSFRDELR